MRQSSADAGFAAAVVPAAGLGRRFGARSGKLFATIDGQPLLVYTLKALQSAPSIRAIQLAVHPLQRRRVERLIRRWRITKALPPCIGGASRSGSVARACRVLPAAARWILVHDGARPCVSRRLIEQAVDAAKRHKAVATGLPAFLTVKEANAAGLVRRTLNRNRLWFVQTPQVFRRDVLDKALSKAAGRLASFPDDAALVEAAGFAVRMLPGDPLNLKVTTQEDLLLAAATVRARRRKAGSRR